MRKWLLILLLAIPLIHAGLLRSPEPAEAGQVVLVSGSCTNANHTVTLTDGSAQLACTGVDFSPFIGEWLEWYDSTKRPIKGYIGSADGKIYTTYAYSTQNWQWKHASYNNNDASGYVYRIIKSKPMGNLTTSGTVTSSDVHLATVDAGAMVEISGVDLSPYAGVDAYTVPKTNLQLHLKADAGCYTDAGKTTACTNDGDKAYTWADQSSAGKDCVQATEGNRFLYKTNIVGSLPAMRFDGTDDYCATAAFASALTQPNTIYIAWAKNASHTTGTTVALDGIGASNLQRFLWDSTNGYQINGGSNAAVGYASSLSASAEVVSAIFNGTSSNFLRNGLRRSGTLSAGTNTMTGATVGAQYDFSNPWHGDIYEILVYNTAHDDATRTRIERYLAGKWGITSYQPTYAATSPARYMLVLEDSAGKIASGYIGAVGGGEATSGSNIITGWSNSGLYPLETFTTSGADISSAINTATIGLAYKDFTVIAGRLYKFIMPFTVNSGAISYFGLCGTGGGSCSSPSSVYSNPTGSITAYITGVASQLGTTITCSSACNYSLASPVLDYLTDISITGVHLHSTPSAYDRKMARVDSGFNPNGVTKYRIYQVANSGYDLDTILQEDMQPIWGNEGASVYLQQEGS